MKYLRYVLIGLGIIFLIFILYGSFKFYFSKPVPNTQNITALPGSTLNVTNKEETIVDKKIKFYAGPLVFSNKDSDIYFGFQCGIIW